MKKTITTSIILTMCIGACLALAGCDRESSQRQGSGSAQLGMELQINFLQGSNDDQSATARMRHNQGRAAGRMPQLSAMALQSAPRPLAGGYSRWAIRPSR